MHKGYSTNYFVDSFWPEQKCTSVKLGSTCKATMETHYNRRNVQHLANMEDLIVPAARNIVVADVDGCAIHGYTSIINSKCTLQLAPPNMSLQWVLDGTEYGENISYAKQSTCPNNMTIAQYIEFTRIRAGGALQLRNIVRAIHESMDFTSPASFDLLCQALWQVGPLDSADNIVCTCSCCCCSNCGRLCYCCCHISISVIVIIVVVAIIVVVIVNFIHHCSPLPQLLLFVVVNLQY